MRKIQHDLYNMWGFNSQKESQAEKEQFDYSCKITAKLFMIQHAH